jgi:prophage regulatory protein
MQNAPTKEMMMNDITSRDMNAILIRIPQILKMMPISKSKFWLMVQKGEFPKPIKIGRSSFWTIEQVQAFIRERTSQSTN